MALLIIWILIIEMMLTICIIDSGCFIANLGGDEECPSFTGDLTSIREAIKEAIENYKIKRGI